MKRFLINHPKWSSLILFVAIVIIFFLVCLFHLEDGQNFEADLTYSILALLLSIIVILLAYIKTQEAIKQSRTSYLLRIDERIGHYPAMSLSEARKRFIDLSDMRHGEVNPKEHIEEQK